MPPLNENTGNAYPEAQIPGMTLMNDGQATASAVSLRTHSSKFPIERELILSADKASSKIPLMHESRAQRSVGLSLLTRQTGSIAPDHPPKQMHAWQQQQQQQQSTPLSQQQIQSSSDTGAITRTPARFPEDVTALADRDNVGRDLTRDSNKNAVTKTYHTLKDLISSKFKKDSGDPADELNNVIVHQQHQLQSLVGRQSIEELRPHMDMTSHIHQMHQNLNQSQPNILASSSNIQKMNGTNGGIGGEMHKTPQQRAASQPQLNSTGFSRHATNDVVTDSDDGGFASRATTNRRPQTLYYLTNPNQQPPQFVGNQRQQHTTHTHMQDMMHKKRFHETHMMSHPPPQPPMHQPKELRKVMEQDKSTAGRPGPGPGPDTTKQTIGSPNSSDYDKSGNQSSNVDSGRGSAANSSGRKAPQLDSESFDSPLGNDDKGDDSEWVDIVDAELRYILEPGIQNLSIRPESTVSGSVSSISPPLPPLSPDNSSFHMPSNSKHAKDASKQEYGTDSYNRPGRGPIGPSRAGWPGSALHKNGYSHGKAASKFSAKKHEQAALKRHLFGLDNDLTSTTTRSLDLESLLGGAWGTTQSISDSETDTQGLRHIRSQLEGLEHMYGEVLKMLGNRSQMRISDSLKNRGMGGIRRRHGSLSSLPSSSISGRPIRDRRRNDDRRKVKDVKGINKRFQRLESHVVTLARSVAHLSSEMRSQHLVTQELEKLRDEFAAISRGRTQNLYRGPTIANSTIEPEPTNLTNPRRVKKLTKFFGEDPPLMRLFLKNLGYEKYANLFEAEHVGMIELPYLGEERLQKMGVPLGPRLRILQEAQISLCKDTTLCIV